MSDDINNSVITSNSAIHPSSSNHSNQALDHFSDLLQSNGMQARQLFGIPIFRRKFDRHAELKERTLEYFKDKENFRQYSHRPNLLFTSANLHREELFKPYTDFILDSLRIALDAIGYEPNIALTGLWGTVHPNRGYHHRHTHYNSFFAGVYYLDGGPNTTGTTFFNPITSQNIIVPKLKDGRLLRGFSEITVPFEEGTLVIFPAWLPHNTATNNIERTHSYRKILSFNSMPVGPTNCDIYDRYNYGDVSDDTTLPSVVSDAAGRENWQENGLVDREPYFQQFETKEEGQ